MGGCRCTYKNCQNTTKTTENIHFFHYPVKHKERCKIWIENAEKPHFCDLEEEQLRNKVICEMHFEDRYFPNEQKKRLLQAAIPTLDGGCDGSNKSDLKVLPVNEDGTEFVLDSDSMFNRIAAVPNKIETFIYKDGAIVPVDSDKTNGGDFDELNKNSTSMDIDIKSTTDNVKHGVYVFLDENSIPKPEKSCNTINDNKNTPIKLNTDITEKKTMVQRSTNTKHSHTTKIFKEKNYLRKLQQHSREIANIKRMLKRNLVNTRPEKSKLIKEFQNDLPSTLFTIINLCLGTQVDLSDNDIEFFNDLYLASPDMYKLLVEKYNWSLPRIQQTKEEPNADITSK